MVWKDRLLNSGYRSSNLASNIWGGTLRRSHVRKRGKIGLNHSLTLTLLTWTIWRAPTCTSKWQMEFNSGFKGLTL